MSLDPNRPFVICVDLDGVVADYEQALRHAVADMLGRDPATMGPQLRWDFYGENSDWGIRDREHFLDLHQQAVVGRRMFATMPAMEGASDVLWWLSDEYDVNVRIVTHRLVRPWSHDLVVADTVRWLQRGREQDGRPRIPYKDVCFIADKAEVGGDLYFDDAPHNISALRSAGFDAVVFDAPYNRDIDGPRVLNWDEAGKLVVARIAERREREAAAAN